MAVVKCKGCPANVADWTLDAKGMCARCAKEASKVACKGCATRHEPHKVDAKGLCWQCARTAKPAKGTKVQTVPGFPVPSGPGVAGKYVPGLIAELVAQVNSEADLDVLIELVDNAIAERARVLFGQSKGK
jgi:hypothetical protein